MTKRVVLMGDIHGSAGFGKFCEAVESSPHPVIQIGDFGLGFRPGFDSSAKAFMEKNAPKARFIRGNHDNPAVCRQTEGYIEDGTVEGGTMFIGGAWSMDWRMRTKGVDWWPGEEATQEEFDRMLAHYEEIRPKVMVTHDGPDSVFRRMFGYDEILDTRTGRMLGKFLSVHQPSLWVFGHHHRSVDFEDEMSGTRFRCLGEAETMEAEI